MPKANPVAAVGSNPTDGTSETSLFRLKQPSIRKSYFRATIGQHCHAAYQEYGDGSHLALGSYARMTCILQPYLTLALHREQVRGWLRLSIGLCEIRQYRTSAAAYLRRYPCQQVASVR